MQWEPVVDGLWTGIKFAKSGFEMRSMVVRLDDGSTLVSSPPPGLDDAGHAALCAIGRPSVLLAPNHFHNMGLAAFHERYPEARVVCSAGARPRLMKKVPLTYEALDTVQLPAGMRLVEPPGLKVGETWLIVERDGARIWSVCDTFFNLAAHPKGAFGLVTRLGGSAPGLRISRLFKLGAVADRAAWRDWMLAQIETAPPTLLIPAHGDQWPVDRAALTELVRRRLG